MTVFSCPGPCLEQQRQAAEIGATNDGSGDPGAQGQSLQLSPPLKNWLAISENLFLRWAHTAQLKHFAAEHLSWDFCHVCRRFIE